MFSLLLKDLIFDFISSVYKTDITYVSPWYQSSGNYSTSATRELQNKLSSHTDVNHNEGVEPTKQIGNITHNTLNGGISTQKYDHNSDHAVPEVAPSALQYVPNNDLRSTLPHSYNITPPA